jgi:hypothetical protein
MGNLSGFHPKMKIAGRCAKIGVPNVASFVKIFIIGLVCELRLTLINVDWVAVIILSKLQD